MTSFIQISRSTLFNQKILPLILEKAKVENKTRDDIIRDIVYQQFHYIPKAKTKLQIAMDHATEQSKQREIGNRHIVFLVDHDFKDLIYQSYILKQSAKRSMTIRMNKTILDMIFNYFGVPLT